MEGNGNVSSSDTNETLIDRCFPSKISLVLSGSVTEVQLNDL